MNSSLFVRLYIDEDVHESIASELRRRGYDVLNTREVNQRGLPDTEQLAYAATENRTLFSFNAADYIALHKEYLEQGKEHSGIVISNQIPIGETTRRLLALLDQVSANEMKNQLRWLPSL